MKLIDQLKKDVLFLMTEEMKELQSAGKITEAPLSSDHCFNVFYCESDLSEEQLKLFTEVYYENEDYIHDTLESWR